MHVSAYEPDGRFAVVYLDGRKLETCYEADSKEGTALCHSSTGMQPVERDPVSDIPRIFILRGKVKIEKRVPCP